VDETPFLNLNIDKTDVMDVSVYPKLRPKVFDQFSINLVLDHDIELIFNTVTQVRYLGFILDDTLCFEDQVNQVVKVC